MNNNINYTQELEKVMGVFNYRGCLVKSWGDGYFVLDNFCPNLEKVDMVIDSALQSLSKSILK
jgi:hypothetical protein